MTIEIYSDVVCPWCYIGDRRFERAVSRFAGRDRLEVVYRSFQLDPAMPAQPIPLREYLRRKFGPQLEAVTEHVAAVARDEGIRMDFENALAVNTLTAHRLLRLAEHEYGSDLQRPLVRKLFEAHFEHAADISDHATLTSVAASVDLNPVRVREYLGSNEGLQETRAELALSLERGIRAVPTFVCQGRYALEGAQPAATLLRALKELTAREFEAPSVPDDAG